jgi:O-antigen ligase
MEAIGSVIYFLVLFLAVCLFVIIVIAIINILNKSFKPKNSLILLSILLIFFLLSATLTLTNVSDAIDQISGDDTNNPAPVRPRNSGDSVF